MKNECTDKRFEKMLYAFELDILSDSDRRELEIHLLECDACFETASNFEKAALLITRDPEVKNSVTEESEPGRSDSTIVAPVSPSTSIIRKLVPAIAALLILTALVFKPWQIEITPTDEAIAAPNRLAVMYFDNLADSSDTEQLGQIITNLLITDLSESHYVQVVSSQRLFDLSRLLGYKQVESVDMKVATQIARKAEARWMLIGHVLSDDPHLVISGQILDVSTGDVLTSRRVSAENHEDIFALVDRFSSEVKRDLEISPEALTEPDRAVADITTHSKEAYRHYLEGVDYMRMMYFREAHECFLEALILDSTMAMAYYCMSVMGDLTQISKAVQYIDHVGERDKYYIRSREASYLGNYRQAMKYLEEGIKRFPDEKDYYMRLGWFEYRLRHFDKAIELARRSLEIDPLYDMAYNQLAYSYARLGEFDSALMSADKYIELIPNEANPYDTRGDVLVMMGSTNEARKAYRGALEIKPDYSSSRLSLAKLSILENDLETAKEELQPLLTASDEGLSSIGMHYSALVSMKTGRFEDALTMLDDGLVLDASIRFREQQAIKRWLKILIYGESGREEYAYEELARVATVNDTAISPHPELGLAYYHIQMVAQTGRLEYAERFSNSLRQDMVSTRAGRFGYNYGMGCVEFARTNYEKAISHFKVADTTYDSYATGYMLARSYLAAGQHAEAVDKFEELLAQLGTQRLYWCILDPKIHYYLGYALEESGDTQTAINHYRTALEIWKDADTDIEELQHARLRLQNLEKTS